MRPTSPYPKCIGDPQACSGLQCPKRAFPCINEERRRATAERIKNGTYFRPANSNESITYKDGKFEESLKKMMRMYPGDGGYRSDPPKVRPKGVLRVYKKKDRKPADPLPKISDEVYQRAYCGDGILRYILGRTYRHFGGIFGNDIPDNPKK